MIPPSESFQKRGGAGRFLPEPPDVWLETVLKDMYDRQGSAEAGANAGFNRPPDAEQYDAFLNTAAQELNLPRISIAETMSGVISSQKLSGESSDPS